jgi:hypothetical protein
MATATEWILLYYNHQLKQSWQAKIQILRRATMIISDLNYMEVAEANVEGGYYFGDSTSTYISETLNINKTLVSKVYIKGNFAGAEAEAYATGPNTATQGVTFTNVVKGYGSVSKATSVSGTSGYSYVW